MGVLDNRTLTVDAILSKKGRELLSKGQSYFNITKYALADDEIDYTLWNENHPSGSNYYGYAIEQLPMIEAVADETQVMRYKLVTLDKSTVLIPSVYATPTTMTLNVMQYATIQPGTNGSSGLNSTLGYTCILHNSDVAVLEAVVKTADENGEFTKTFQSATVGSPFLSDSDLARSVFVKGTQFRVTAKMLQTTTTTKLTIIGNETGGSTSLTLTVNAINTAQLIPQLS